MAKDTLDAVRHAEQEAEKILENAAHRSAAIRQSAENKAAELRAQLPQRWLRPLQLQRRRSLLQPHAKLHGGGAGGAALPPALRSERAPAG